MEQVKQNQMCQFFKIGDQKYQTSLFINMRLLGMGKEEIVVACQKFGLQPVKQYLDIRTINGDNEKERNLNVRGYLRYMDIYLIQMSGGKRKELIKLGEELTGKNYTASSLRLIRLDIISSILASL